jgi:hypothetical protein
MNTRIKAMRRSRVHFAAFASAASSTMYRIYEDGPPPQGDGQFSPATDALVGTYFVQTPYHMVLSRPSMTLITFTTKGMLDSGVTGTIWMTPDAGGEYDCVALDQIKTFMGKWNGTQCINK